MSKSIAFLGLGAMGLPMALNLQRKGFTVTGWNRSPGKGDALLAAGGRMADSPAEAVRQADIVVTMLADPQAVAAVAAAFLPAAPAGAVWVECSTVGPTVARELSQRAAEGGTAFLDAPVLGSVKPATEGTLHFVVGGDAAVLERVRPALAAMGPQVTHFGETGSGAAAKIVSNMITGTLVAALGEALALSERLGLDRSQMAELLMNGPAGSPIVRGKAPLMLSEQFDALFQLRWMEKDLSLALAEALRLGAPLGASAGAHAEFAGARAAGLGDQDFAAVGAFIRRMAQGPRSGA